MINFLAPINNTTGYGITSTNIWKNIRKKTDISVYPVGDISLENPNDGKLLQEDINNTISGDTRGAPCLKIWHMHDLFSRIGNGKYGVFPFFEIDKLKEVEVAGLKHADVVFTTCEWSKKIIANHGIDESKIKICPLGVDHSIFNISTKPPKSEGSTYRFINIGKWEVRKGHDILVHLFNEAFTKDDDVELWMVNHNPFLQPAQIQQWQELYTGSKLGDKIKCFDRLKTHSEVASVIYQADCGLYISRAEGWNNEIPETMAMDKPVIATNYSAHTAYCNKDNSFLVDVDELEPAVDGIWFDGSGKWAKLGVKQMEQIVEHMRYVYKNNIRSNKAGLDTAAALTWANTSKIIHDELFLV
jgi:glycosyltransferase involved in cell wall biosynthesis